MSVIAGSGAATAPEFAQLEAYWQALRPDGAGLPRRADVDPRGIAAILDRVLVLERIAPGQMRIRLAGMAVCAVMGMELRGMPVSALLVPEARAGFGAHLDRVLDGPGIGRLRLDGERGMMRPPFGAELLVLPMLGRAGVADQALACLVTTGRAGRVPRRFALAGAGMRPVAGASPAREPVPGMAEAPARFAAPCPGRPHLRLVKG